MVILYSICYSSQQPIFYNFITKMSINFKTSVLVLCLIHMQLVQRSCRCNVFCLRS